MADESIIVRNQGTVFLAGPPLVNFILLLYVKITRHIIANGSGQFKIG